MRTTLLAITLLQLTSLWAARPVVCFSENKGQWPVEVLYRSMMPGRALFVEPDALTFVLWSGSPLDHHGVDHQHTSDHHVHAYQVRFAGALDATPAGLDPLPHYENYFLGNDPAHWASQVNVYRELQLRALYPGINMRLHGGDVLKYDLIVEPGADACQIRMTYEGQDRLELREGSIVVHTTAGHVTEHPPVTYQLRAGARIAVRSAYALSGSEVHFVFPDGYDPTLPLVIDPVLSFATLTGSTANNFGSTATYDDSGHLYGGGTAFAAGYPTTLGVLQPTYGGGNVDIALTKFSTDGTALIWSTYLGGSMSETPHSLVVNDNDELFVLGTCGSADFPTTAGAYDQTFNGGPMVDYTAGYGFEHLNGVDIIVAHLNSAGTGLMGSTFIGGTGNDGVNDMLPLLHNYGDVFRGEIALDLLGRPVVATSTQSADAPITVGAPQGIYGGSGQDGYLFRLNTALSILELATFHGGSGLDAGYGVQFDSNGNIFMTGGTSSIDLPTPGTPLNPSNAGGVDAYVAKFSPSGTMLNVCTYLGTNDYDQSYFVQIDLDDDVYVVGQSEGNYPVTPGVFSEPNSGQFIQKMDNDLTTSFWSTVIGSGNGSVDISPTAFLVSNCGQIYLAGWGSSIQSGTLSTTGLTVTPDAEQATTDGNDLYLVLLGPDASSLVYATYFGGDQSTEHVDGGTSRFDKDGNVYHAVCAGCGGNSDFPTTPGAWSAVNGSSCNLGVLKFNLSQSVAVVDINGPDYLCLPDGAQFVNLSTGGNQYYWQFGDNTTSNDFEPYHVYGDTGTYVISMILSDTTGCVLNDTASIVLHVYDPLDAMVEPPDTVCPGGTVQLNASGGLTYAWSPSAGLSDPTIATPMATVMGNTTYQVIIADSCSIDTISVDIVVSQPNAVAGPDVTMCIGDSVQLSASGGTNFSWSPTAGLDDPFSATPMASPSDTTQYVVTVSDGTGCTSIDSLLVTVQFSEPLPLGLDTLTCAGDPVQIQAGIADTYAWTPAPDLSATNISSPTVQPSITSTYYVTLTNTCGSVLDSAVVHVPVVVANAWPDQIICPGDSALVFASGGVTYAWTPTSSVGDPLGEQTFVFPSAPTQYQVVAYDANGCTDTAFVSIDLYPEPTVYAGEDQVIEFGGSAQLLATGQGGFLWSPDSNLTCTECPDPIADPITSTAYTVELTDANGCTARDIVQVILEGTLYVPNTFTPNGDGINDTFFAQATEVKDFKLFVFNRWGELIFESDRMDRFWNGTYRGTESPIDTYVWKVEMTELSGRRHRRIGHVNLIR